MKTLSLLAVLLATLPVSALAAGKFVAPKGCKVYVTVQHADCQVSNHYRCEGDPAGVQWSVYAGQDGPYYMSKIDDETRWLEDYDLARGEANRLGRETDAASFSELLATGLDSYDFTTVNSMGQERRYQGFDRLTDEKVTIDGVDLERTEFDLTTYAPDGTALNRRTGKQLISRDWRIFFSDSEQFDGADGERVSTKSTPVTFSQPGDKGYLAGAPEQGCNQMMTGLFAPVPRF